MIISIKFYNKDGWIDYKAERIFFHYQFIYLYNKKLDLTNSFDTKEIYEYDIQQDTKSKQN